MLLRIAWPDLFLTQDSSTRLNVENPHSNHSYNIVSLPSTAIATVVSR